MDEKETIVNEHPSTKHLHFSGSSPFSEISKCSTYNVHGVSKNLADDGHGPPWLWRTWAVSLLVSPEHYSHLLLALLSLALARYTITLLFPIPASSSRPQPLSAFSREFSCNFSCNFSLSEGLEIGDRGLQSCGELGRPLGRSLSLLHAVAVLCFAFSGCM